MTEGEKMIDILDTISGYDIAESEFRSYKNDKWVEVSLDVCPLCGGKLSPIGMYGDDDIMCKCKVCGIAVFR